MIVVMAFVVVWWRFGSTLNLLSLLLEVLFPRYAQRDGSCYTTSMLRSESPSKQTEKQIKPGGI